MSKVIIIHPGSLYLRIGKSSEANPEVILNCIARRRKNGGKVHYDQILPVSEPIDDSLNKELTEARLNVSHSLQNCLQSDGRKRIGTPSQQLAMFNKRVQPEIVTNQPQHTWLKPKEKIPYVVGADVLRLDPNSKLWNLHFPIRRGEFNLHDGVNGSMFSCLEDLRTIWEYAIENYLEVDLKDLKDYKAILIIPDIYHRKRVKEMVALLFRMGFSASLLIQENVAATFGSGLSYACVVDIGDQKISVSCVEDAVSHQNTRVSLKFGGGDVTQCFFWLLQKVSFPYKECNPKIIQDAVLLNHLKETSCHLNMNICGSQEKSFVINRPDQTPSRYVLQVADELLIAPLSIFYTDLLKLTLGNTSRENIVQIQKTLGQDIDSEDCFNAEFLRESGRRGNAGYTKDQAESFINANDTNNEVDEDIVVDDADKDSKFNDFQMSNDQIIGLDTAIIQSIEHLANEELKKKMYNCILLVGGGSKTPGLNFWLQNKIQQTIPQNYRADNQDFVLTSKEADAGNISWRGAAVLSNLEASEELWISKEDFECYGVRVVREKAPFIW
jgi:actin-related protein 8